MDKIENIKLNCETTQKASQIIKCSHCHDTGWVETVVGVIPCVCQKEAQLQKIAAFCGVTPVLQNKTFAAFELAYYEEYLKNDKGVTFRNQALKLRDVCKEYAASFVEGKTMRGLLLQGDVGRGKTFLAAAICNALILKGIKPYFMVVPEFLDEIRATYNSGGEFSEAHIMEKALNAPLLILDDLGSHNFSAWTIGKLFTLINYRVNHGLPMIVTTNLNLGELQDTLGERTLSRIVEVCDFYCLQSAGDIRIAMNMK